MHNLRGNRCGYTNGVCTGIFVLPDIFTFVQSVEDTVRNRADDLLITEGEEPHAITTGTWLNNYENIPKVFAGVVDAVDMVPDMSGGSDTAEDTPSERPVSLASCERDDVGAPVTPEPVYPFIDLLNLSTYSGKALYRRFTGDVWEDYLTTLLGFSGDYGLDVPILNLPTYRSPNATVPVTVPKGDPRDVGDKATDTQLQIIGDILEPIPEQIGELTVLTDRDRRHIYPTGDLYQSAQCIPTITKDDTAPVIAGTSGLTPRYNVSGFRIYINAHPVQVAGLTNITPDCNIWLVVGVSPGNGSASAYLTTTDSSGMSRLSGGVTRKVYWIGCVKKFTITVLDTQMTYWYSVMRPGCIDDVIVPLTSSGVLAVYGGVITVIPTASCPTA